MWGSLEYSNSAGRYYKPREEDPKFKNIVTAKLGTITIFCLEGDSGMFNEIKEGVKFRICFLSFQNLVSL